MKNVGVTGIYVRMLVLLTAIGAVRMLVLAASRVYDVTV
jgi:hypothetical protein